MTALRVERLEPDDWQRFRAVRQASLRADPGAFAASAHRWLHELDEEARWRDRLGAVTTFVACSAGVDVGTAGLGRDHELLGMWVAAGARGLGAGRALVDAVLSQVPHGSGAHLRVMAANAAAVAFYERCGFVLVGGGPDDEGCLTMERRAG